MDGIARSKQVCIEWMEATVLFCRDCLRKREIYIHVVYAPYAPLTTPVPPVDDALLALLGQQPKRGLLATDGRGDSENGLLR